jgi:glutathione S-transferase
MSKALTAAQKDRHLILWGAGTTRTMRPHWVLQELSLNYEMHLIGSRTGETETPEFRTLNPRGKIPVLQDGDLTLVESAAIVTYLADTYGAETGLVPPPLSRLRALYNQWCFFVMTELDAHTLYIIRRHRDLAPLYGEAPNAIRAAEEGFARQVEVAAQVLRNGGPYLLGETFTGADVLLTTCLTWANFYGLPLADVLADYMQRLTSREAHQRAAAINYASS